MKRANNHRPDRRSALRFAAQSCALLYRRLAACGHRVGLGFPAKGESAAEPMGNHRHRALLFIACVSFSFLIFGQGRFRSGWGESYIGENERTAREVASHSTGTPVWTNPAGFEKDVFTFVRVRRDSGGFARGAPWSTDAPDSDLNLSYRLQQMTSLKVNPDGRFLRLTDPDLANYPFIYMVEPGSLYLSEP